MSGVNKVIVLGRLGQEPEMRYTQGGEAIARLSLATSSRYKDKATGEPREDTEWHRAVCFGRTAEIAGQYLTKGRECYLEGRLKTRKWQDSTGQDRYTTEIVVEQLTLIGGTSVPQVHPAPAPRPDARAALSQQPPNPAPAPASAPATQPDFDDDIPF